MSDKKATASGGVRNLRAMFENKDEATSPPDRGRSPGISSIGGSSTGTSPRPLSKVRTSFVTVENRSGQWGLKRDTSGEPSLAKRRPSFSVDEQEDPKATAARKESIVSELEARKNSTVIEEAIPECAVETPSMEVDKQLEEPAQKQESLSKTLAQANVESKQSVSGGTNGTTNGHGKPKESATKSEEKPKASARPAPISTAKPSATKTSKSVPIKTPKTPTSPMKSSPKPTLAKEPEKKAVKASAASSNNPKQRRPSHGSVPPPSLRIQPSPPRTGFVKPKPRSPTRPVRLPASLTAHTASSGSKTAVASPPNRQTLSRASGNAQSNTTRSPSRATGSKAITRNPSTTNKTSSRPSLGPPPGNTLNKKTSRQSLPGHGAPADEGFLARMMRPTTSSASKTAEKVPDTPPKRTQSVKRPMAKDGPPRMSDLSKHAPVTKTTKTSTNIPTKQAKDTATKRPEASKTIKKVEPRPVKPALETKDKKPAGANVESANAIRSKEVKSEPEPETIKEPAVEEQVVEETASKVAELEEPQTGTNAAELEVEDATTEPKAEEPKAEIKGEETDAVKEPTAIPAEVSSAEQSVAEDAAVSEADDYAQPIAKVGEIEVEEIEPQETEVREIVPIASSEEPEETGELPQAPLPVHKDLPTSEVLPSETLESSKEDVSNTETVEDPADIAARAEIAKLNAELMGASPVSEIIRTDEKEPMESY
ncbi:mucin-7 precursor protein [Phlyctema vagabunda]|uniref:Mucin-7 protein n=1 Tax=Phlyctema vagabunda TaxID=108571 RepID=A0ABR4PDI5_9HELO